MASKGLSIGVSVEWVKQPGECRQCKACEDQIFGNAYVLVVTVAGKREETDTILCEPCKYPNNENIR